jgi:hypothetical protein
MEYFKKTGKQDIYESTKDLSTLANELETDKGTADSSQLSWGSSFPRHFCWGYTEVYKKYMDAFREKPVKFLEIGVCDKRFKYASTKMWMKYFKDLDFYCVDNFWGTGYQQEAHNIENLNSLGVNFIYADQYSKNDWDGLEKIIGSESLDFLVEDGSHWYDHMIYSLWRGAKILKKGGYYFMEDIQNHETSKGFWGYDNADLSIELKNFLLTGKLVSSNISQIIIDEIVNSFKIVDIILDNKKLNYLAVFCKK